MSKRELGEWLKGYSWGVVTGITAMYLFVAWLGSRLSSS